MTLQIFRLIIIYKLFVFIFHLVLVEVFCRGISGAHASQLLIFGWLTELIVHSKYQIIQAVHDIYLFVIYLATLFQ
jgi:hypothetical protein